MRKGRRDEGEALTKKIGSLIIKHNSNKLKSVQLKDSKSLWMEVNKITNKRKSDTINILGLTASELNTHYAKISTDANYIQPNKKSVHLPGPEIKVDEFTVFKVLDTIKPSSSGPDEFPSWFLRLAAPFISRSLAHLYTLSINTGIVPRQWKGSVITPVCKTATPAGPSDYRPISVTSILCRKLEHIIVDRFIYPAMYDPPPNLIFEDQYAFRPTGSATAALIAILDSVIELLNSGHSVVVISLDFSKAFDRIRHKTLFENMDELDIDDHVYNWLLSYFEDRQHCTKFCQEISSNAGINASVVQGSGIGPSSFSIAAANLKAKNREFRLHKFADDITLVTTLDHYEKIEDELDHVGKWADKNNLVLNKNKSKELIFRKNKDVQLPEPTVGIERVTSMRTLGVVLQGSLKTTEHVDSLLTKASNSMYALNVLRTHGMPAEGLHAVFRAKILSRITYASSAWWGLSSQHDIQRIDSFLKKAVKLNFYPESGLRFVDLCRQADDSLFKNIIKNKQHVLYKMLPQIKETRHDLRKRGHNFVLPSKDDRLFINRTLFRLK